MEVMLKLGKTGRQLETDDNNHQGQTVPDYFSYLLQQSDCFSGREKTNANNLDFCKAISGLL